MKKKLLKSLRVLLVATGLCVGASANAQTVTATITGFTDNGDGTYYPVYTLKTTDAENAEVEGVTYSVTTPAEGTYATISGNTLTITAQYTAWKQWKDGGTYKRDKENTDFTITATKDAADYATVNLPYVGKYVITSSYDFSDASIKDMEERTFSNNGSNNLPGMTTKTTRYSSNSASSAIYKAFPGLNVAFTGDETIYYFDGYGIGLLSGRMRWTLDATQTGQIAVIQYKNKGANTATTWDDTPLQTRYYETPGTAFSVGKMGGGTGNPYYLWINYKVYTPQWLTEVPGSNYVWRSSKGSLGDKYAGLSGLVFTAGNISSATSTVINKWKGNTDTYGIEVAHLGKDALTAISPSHYTIVPNTENYSFLELNVANNYLQHKEGINVRKYSSSNQYTYYTYTLIDGKNYGYHRNGFTPTNYSAYTREFTPQVVNSLCVPFTFTISDEVGEFYTLASLTDGKATFTKVDAGTSTANTPYLFIPAAGVTSLQPITFSAYNAENTLATEQTGITFQGTLLNTTIKSDEDYTLYGFTTTGKFVKIPESDTELKAFRAYLKVPAAAASRGISLSFGDESTTAISSFSFDKVADNTYYSLSGLRITAPTKGIYIHNGKKTIIK